MRPEQEAAVAKTMAYFESAQTEGITTPKFLWSTRLNMASVGFILIGAFQPEHVFGGLIGATITGLLGLLFIIWSKK